MLVIFTKDFIPVWKLCTILQRGLERRVSLQVGHDMMDYSLPFVYVAPLCFSGWESWMPLVCSSWLLGPSWCEIFHDPDLRVLRRESCLCLAVCILLIFYVKKNKFKILIIISFFVHSLTVFYVFLAKSAFWDCLVFSRRKIGVETKSRRAAEKKIYKEIKK